MDATRRKNTKMLAAFAGASALVALVAVGVLTLADCHQRAGTDTIAHSKMTLGDTSTQKAPPKSPETPMAVPAIKGPAPLPSEEEAAK